MRVSLIWENLTLAVRAAVPIDNLLSLLFMLFKGFDDHFFRKSLPTASCARMQSDPLKIRVYWSH